MALAGATEPGFKVRENRDKGPYRLYDCGTTGFLGFGLRHGGDSGEREKLGENGGRLFMIITSLMPNFRGVIIVNAETKYVWTRPYFFTRKICHDAR